jgi:hypothetical protein
MAATNISLFLYEKYVKSALSEKIVSFKITSFKVHIFLQRPGKMGLYIVSIRKLMKKLIFHTNKPLQKCIFTSFRHKHVNPLTPSTILRGEYIIFFIYCVCAGLILAQSCANLINF